MMDWHEVSRRLMAYIKWNKTAGHTEILEVKVYWAMST